MCDRPRLTNAHPGQTFSDVKYALHCETLDVLERCVVILRAIGFEVFKRETTGIHHTFMRPPADFMRRGTFQYVLVVKPDGNHQTIRDSAVQGVHLGFRTSNMRVEAIRRRVCELTKTIVIEKPDETSLFIELPCGEVVEVVGRPTDWRDRATRALFSLVAVYLIWKA